MQGLAIGVISGALALYFLARAARAITSGDVLSACLPFLCNTACIAAALALGVLFFRSQMAWLGGGIAVSLVGGAFAQFILRGRGK